MNIEEAVKAALEYENRVYDVYNDNADKLKSETAKKIFATLAKEEQDHVKYLEAKLEQCQSGNSTDESLDTILPDLTKGTIERNIKKLKKKVPVEEGLSDEIEIFKKALALETETATFYKRLVSKVPAEDRKFFEQFVKIEEGHAMIVQAEIDNAKNSGFWFDFMEFDLEAG